MSFWMGLYINCIPAVEKRGWFFMIHCIKLESQGIILFFPQKRNETPDFDLHLLYNDSTISMAQKHKNIPSGTESAQFIETGDV